jgi:uridine kinase
MTNNSDINRHILQECINKTAAGKRKEYSSEIQFVFAVSGAAALGKTTFCKNLAGFLNDNGVETKHIPLEGFMLDRKTRQDGKLSGYNPQSTDIPFLIKTLKELL